MTTPEHPDDPLANSLADAFVDILKKLSDGAVDSVASAPDDESERLAEYVAATAAPDKVTGRGFECIAQDDAEFDVDAFYGRVAEMFLAVHAAMDARDVSKVSHFLSPDALRSINMRILGVSAEPPAGNLSLSRCKALAVRREGGQHIVHIRIVAERAQGGILSEYWTLVRDVGARSKAGASIMRCPNCGAPIDGEDRLRCSYCDQQLCDPALDWIVDEIRPEAE
jgi:hypothetical protein